MKGVRKLEYVLGAVAKRSDVEIRRVVSPLVVKSRRRQNPVAANRIFIAGCGRSGTTLTLRLMACFEDIFVRPSEARHTMLDMLDRPEPNLVVKRDFRTFARLAKSPPAIGLIYCVRHPFDVLTSSHPQTKGERRFHVTPERWLAEYDALMQLRKDQPQRQILYLRYEDTIGEPDAVQEKIARSLGLTPRIRFSEDPANPIRASSLKKWERNEEFQTYLHGLPTDFLARVEGFCSEFGYDMPKRPGR